MTQKTAIVVDDDDAIRTVLNQALVRAGYQVRPVATIAQFWRLVAEGEGDVAITDVMLPDGNVFDLLPRIKKHRPQLPILVMSAKNTIMTAIAATEAGAFDYLSKPFDLNELVNLVNKSVEKNDVTAIAHDSDEGLDDIPIIGRSQAMQEIYRVVARMTRTDLTVMIVGESGTGKELVARALHEFGTRKHQPFVAVNMAAIPRELIESELFGHEKGAFTGATNRYAGRFEQAHGGTLFLDEIGDMPLEAQTRLLRVLQEGEFTTVGGRRAIKTDVRIIAATHRDLRQLISVGKFREDLFFRLNVVPLRLPPLRERSGDIDDLVPHFLRQAEQQGLPLKGISKAAMERLKNHSWPGNVRELENLMQRICAIYPDDEISKSVVEREISSHMLDSGMKGSAANNSASLSEGVERYLSGYFAEFKGELPPNGLYERVLRQVEAPLISAALAAVNGNQLKAAEFLGINRNTLRSRIRDLNIRVVRNSGGDGVQS